MRPKIFICCRIGSKDRAGFERNLAKARMYTRWAVLYGYDPESTGFYYCAFLDDFSPDERKLGQELGRERLKKCDYMLLIEDGEPHSSGMIGDIEVAKANNVITLVKTHQEIIDWLCKNDYAASRRMFITLLP
ncbi:MAG: hypothetical protein AAB527_01850 [Patescibacteria group bacterium]|mgnify:CR=1